VLDLLRAVWDRADTWQPVYTWEDVATWPPGAKEQLLAAGLLRAAANAASLACDACGGRHVEEVTFVESPPGTGLRAYIACPEAGRVRVILEHLQRWEVDFPRLAAAAANALDAGGAVEELWPGRVWLLGRATLAGETRELFLARGLCWADGSTVLANSARVLASARPVVFVPGAVPAANVWPGAEPPPVLPLPALLSWGAHGLTTDRAYLESALGRGTRKRPPAVVRSFPTPRGATWEDVRLRVADHHLDVEVKGKRQTFAFQEAGFEERRRRNVPDRLWALLRALAIQGGVIPLAATGLDDGLRNNLKQSVSQLGKRLSTLLQLDGKPFKNTRKTRRYDARFTICAADGVRFPAPAGTTWDQVTITEVKGGKVRVSVDARTTFPVYAPKDDEGGDRSTWQAAEGEECLERQYDLRTLSLADGEGRPTPAGEVLRDLLRAGGKVQRPEHDTGMLALCDALSRLMQLDGSPFQYSRSQQMWSALFEVGTLADYGAR
jgi:hypothetical protein